MMWIRESNDSMQDALRLLWRVSDEQIGWDLKSAER
jgi:hypothetical protein